MGWQPQSRSRGEKKRKQERRCWMTIDHTGLADILAAAEQLWTPSQIDAALDAMAVELNDLYKGQLPLLLCVMNGGLVTTGHLTTRLGFFPEISYLHVSRYRGETSGGALEWRVEPLVSVKGRDVILVDDIFDEGYTLAAIDRYCRDQGALSVRTVVLVEKRHDRKVEGFAPSLVGLTVDDRYVVGFGMDYQEYFRNLPGIYALK